MAKSNALKRLERILADEEYGPKLARLNRKDETYVLDLIDRNKGLEARKEIVRLDEQRRAQQRTRRTSKPTRTIDIDELRRKATQAMYRKVNGKPSTIRRSVSHMSTDELNFAINADHEAIRAKAGDVSNIRDYDDEDVPWNVWWYG